MAWATWTPAIAPSQDGYSSTVTAKLLTSSFGDNYVQRAPDGINYIGKTLNITYTILTASEWAAIESFLLSVIGGVPFLYQPPGEAAPIQWTCTTYKRGVFDGANWLGNGITLTQDFTPAP